MSTYPPNPGPYELQQRLRSDANSECWKAFDKQNRRDVAINIYHVGPQAAPTVIPRLQQEARSLVALQHPYIVPIRNVYTLPVPGSSANDVSIVTDYLEGPSLADYLHATAHTGKIPSARDIFQLLAPIAAAIDYAHQRGIIHGAIQPGNILLDQRANTSPGEPKLTGFGTNSIQTPLTLSLDDAAYTSPERVQGYTENARSDIYSLGIILYELCTGTLPFQGETPNDIMMQHIHTVPTSPALINPHMIPALTAVILRSIAKDPVARFSSASAMIVAIARALNMNTQEIPAISGLNVKASGSLSASGPMRAVSASPRQQPPGMVSSATPILNSPSNPLPPPPIVSPSYTPILNTPPGSTPSGGIPTIVQDNIPTVRTSQPFATAGNASRIDGRPSGAYPAMVAPQQAPPYTAPFPPKGRSRNRGLLYTLVGIGLALLVVAAGLGAYFIYFRPATPPVPPQSALAGHAFFVSSGQLTSNTTQGIADRLQVDLAGLPNPHPNKSYYLWLESDNKSQSEALPILVGTASNGGRVDLTFQGDAQHSDLLANYSRFLITEEDSDVAPTNPSLDKTTWRYYAEISQTPNPTDTQNHYSALDHLRHLLAQDPKLKAVGLPGGLDIWLFKNTMKILEWAGSARDAQSSGDTGLVRRQIVRILDYLDGSQYVQTENLPPDLQGLLVDPTIARVALLEFDVQNQNPPGYLKHIGNHLRELSQTPGVTDDQKVLAIQINTAINNVQFWLDKVHLDAEKILKMTPDQLQQSDARTTLDDLFTQANNAFVGQTDPNTNQVKEGVVEIHYNIQRLATFNILPYKAA
ncbi:MAG TPA: protein kinase [Ktedonosporobacter sp.]|nr:protein kinase [Ktedonosporobacter sp.]